MTLIIGGSFTQLLFYAYSLATLFGFLWMLKVVKSVSEIASFAGECGRVSGLKCGGIVDPTLRRCVWSASRWSSRLLGVVYAFSALLSFSSHPVFLTPGLPAPASSLARLYGAPIHLSSWRTST